MADRVARAAALPVLALVVLPLAVLAALGAVRPTQEDAAAWTLELGTSEPHESLALEPIEGFDSFSCSFCHATIAAEWAVTQHAHAWIDPLYQEELKTRRRPESCHGCHIPSPLHAQPSDRFGTKPPAREEGAGDPHKLGITCRTCHGGPNGSVLGPWGEPTDAHPSERSEHFLGTGSNKLCTSCHATTIGPVIGIARDFEQSNLEERGMSCVGCHMQPVERSAATDDNDQPTPVRPGRSHLLQTPRDPKFLAQAFALRARRDARDPKTTVLSIENKAGHRVPGLIGRRIVVSAVALDGAGAELAKVEHTIDDQTYLPLEGVVELRLAAPAERLRVTGLHHAPGAEKPVAFLETTLAVE